MENNTQTQDIKLSESEIALIKLNREKEESAKKEAELKKKIEIEKSIEDKKKEINTFLLFCAAHFNAISTYFRQLSIIDLRFKLVETKRTKTFEGYDYDYVPDPENPGHKKSVKNVFFTEEVPYNDYEITFEGLTDVIDVKEHKVSKSSGRYSYNTTNEGFKMILRYGDNKYYKVAQTVATKLIDKSNQILKEKQRKEVKETAKEQALNFLTKEYPEAVVKHDTKYNSGHRSHTGREISKGYETAFYCVTFANGMEFKFTYGLGANSELIISYYGMSGVKDENITKVINTLKGI